MSHAPTAALSRRHQTVRDALSAAALDALVVTSLPNILYLTNFTGSGAIAVIDPDRIVFITDFRYVTAINSARGAPFECPGLEIVVVESSYDETLASHLKSLAGTRVGFEAAHLTVARHSWLTNALRAPQSAINPQSVDPQSAINPQSTIRNPQSVGPLLVPTEGIVERARVRKDSYEVATIREAARRLAEVARAVLEATGRGRTERETAMSIDWEIRRLGFERSAFDTIVASGPNAALPHARPTERTITEGDLVVLDFGGVYDSYCVDLTRTVVVGRPGPRVREVYDAVRAAHDNAVAVVAPGRSRFDIDAAARETLSRRGLGDAFGHGTGHGLGIEVHEDPRVARRRSEHDTQDERIESGMIFTIEPGAYLPGWGGVRIEDDVLVTDTGVEVLTDVTTELVEWT
jgi:Xaa-Pro aminopeptidase